MGLPRNLIHFSTACAEETKWKREATETQLGRSLMSNNILSRKTDKYGWNIKYILIFSAEVHCSLILLLIF